MPRLSRIIRDPGRVIIAGEATVTLQDTRAMGLDQIGTIECDGEPLKPRNVPVPEPAADEVRIRVHLSAVRHAELDQIEAGVD